MAALTEVEKEREMTEIGFPAMDAGAVGFTDCDPLS